MPGTGVLKKYSPPVGAGIRVDDGVAEGGEVSIHYDPMLSKLIVHAATREACIERMLFAIDNYDIRGVKTTLEFGRFAVDHEVFRSGLYDTGFIKDHFSPEKLVRELPVGDNVFSRNWCLSSTIEFLKKDANCLKRHLLWKRDLTGETGRRDKLGLS